jgi:hypothetical protein
LSTLSEESGLGAALLSGDPSSVVQAEVENLANAGGFPGRNPQSAFDNCD